MGLWGQTERQAEPQYLQLGKLNAACHTQAQRLRKLSDTEPAQASTLLSTTPTDGQRLFRVSATAFSPRNGTGGPSAFNANVLPPTHQCITPCRSDGAQLLPEASLKATPAQLSSYTGTSYNSRAWVKAAHYANQDGSNLLPLLASVQPRTDSFSVPS